MQHIQKIDLKKCPEAVSFAESVKCVAWSDSMRIAAIVQGQENVIRLFSPSAASEFMHWKEEHAFIVSGHLSSSQKVHICDLAWSPLESTLAVSTAEGSIIGFDIAVRPQGDCFKFNDIGTVFKLLWKHEHHIFFACFDGTIKAIDLNRNRVLRLYRSGSWIVSFACSNDGQYIVSGHLDGSILVFELGTPKRTNRKLVLEEIPDAPPWKMVKHGCPPHALTLTREYILAAGGDGIVSIYKKNNGKLLRSLTIRSIEPIEFSEAACSPDGRTILLTAYNHIYSLQTVSEIEEWRLTPLSNVRGSDGISCIRWNSKGSHIVTGACSGQINIHRAKENVHIERILPNHVKINVGGSEVTRLESSQEITKLIVHEDTHAIALTRDSIVIKELKGKLREARVAWDVTAETPEFEFFGVWVLRGLKRLIVVNPGVNSPLATLDAFSTWIVSWVSGKHCVDGLGANEENRPGFIAFLVDESTIRILNLETNLCLADVHCSRPVDWIELCQDGDLLLFRDATKRLFLYSVSERRKPFLLLIDCVYAQWVPSSRLVVAQCDCHIRVWYSPFEEPHVVHLLHGEGEIIGLSRNNATGNILVHVKKDGVVILLPLDNDVIRFYSSVHDEDLAQASIALEKYSKIDSQNRDDLLLKAMRQKLAHQFLLEDKLEQAEKVFAVLNDGPMIYFVKELIELDLVDGDLAPCMKAKIALIQGQTEKAEEMYSDQKKPEQLIATYKSLRKWDQAIRVAETYRHHSLEELQKEYLEYLLMSGQERLAGQYYNRVGRHRDAINLLLKANFPSMAMRIALAHLEVCDSQSLNRLSNALTDKSLYAQAGKLQGTIGNEKIAIEYFLRANAFQEALELASGKHSDKVNEIQEAWGNWLVNENKYEESVDHYICAGKTIKAIEAAFNAEAWPKAQEILQLLRDVDENVARDYSRDLARLLHRKLRFKEAESLYLSTGDVAQPIKMYLDAKMWLDALAVAKESGSMDSVSMLFQKQATKLESEGEFFEAEHILLAINDSDGAINMYQRIERFDHVLRLVSEYKPDEFENICLQIGDKFESRGNLKEAEKYFVKGGAVLAAAEMYSRAEMWSCAWQVAERHGDTETRQQVAYSLVTEGFNFLKNTQKPTILDEAIEYALKLERFEEALDFVGKGMCSVRTEEICFLFAEYLKKNQKWNAAEDSYLQASKAMEAIEMYRNRKDWKNALRVAQQNLKSEVENVLCAQAAWEAEQENFYKAEKLFLEAEKPEGALDMYKDAKMWAEACSFAEKYLPNQLAELNREAKRIRDPEPQSSENQKSHAKVSDLRINEIDVENEARNIFSGFDHVDRAVYVETESALKFVKHGQFEKAIDCFLEIGSGETVEKSMKEIEIYKTAWKHGIHLARKHLPKVEKTKKERVCASFVAFNQFEDAGDLYMEIHSYSKSLDCFVKAQQWEKAEQVTTLAPALKKRLDMAYLEDVRRSRNVEKLVSLGDYQFAMSIYEQENQYEKIFSLIESAALHQFGAIYATKLCSKYLEKVVDMPFTDDALDLVLRNIARYGMTSESSNMTLLLSLSTEILSYHDSEVNPDSDNFRYDSSLRYLRKAIFSFLRDNQKFESLPQRQLQGKLMTKETRSIADALLVTHYYCIYYACIEAGRIELARDILVCILSFAGKLVPQDKAYAMAGSLFMKTGVSGIAFVLLNRYIDIYESMDDQSENEIDNSAFETTDLPPLNKLEIPKEHFLSAEKRSEIRSYVLSLAMEPDFKFEPLKQLWLEETRSKTYESIRNFILAKDKESIGVHEYLNLHPKPFQRQEKALT